MGFKFRQGRDREAWDAAVVGNKVGGQDGRLVDPSECCHVCQEVYPDTKAWDKFVDFTRCNCYRFSDGFDTSKYVWQHESYTMGYCNPKWLKLNKKNRCDFFSPNHLKMCLASLTKNNSWEKGQIKSFPLNTHPSLCLTAESRSKSVFCFAKKVSTLPGWLVVFKQGSCEQIMRERKSQRETLFRM